MRQASGRRSDNKQMWEDCNTDMGRDGRQNSLNQKFGEGAPAAGFQELFTDLEAAALHPPTRRNSCAASSWYGSGDVGGNGAAGGRGDAGGVGADDARAP